MSNSGIVPSPTSYTDLVDCNGELSCLDEWTIQRVETKNIVVLLIYLLAIVHTEGEEEGNLISI